MTSIVRGSGLWNLWLKEQVLPGSIDKALPTRFTPPQTMADKNRIRMVGPATSIKPPQAAGGAFCPSCGQHHRPGSLCPNVLKAAELDALLGLLKADSGIVVVPIKNNPHGGGNPNHDKSTGKFTSGGGSSSSTPSQIIQDVRSEVKAKKERGERPDRNTGEFIAQMQQLKQANPQESEFADKMISRKLASSEKRKQQASAIPEPIVESAPANEFNPNNHDTLNRMMEGVREKARQINPGREPVPFQGVNPQPSPVDKTDPAISPPKGPGVMSAQGVVRHSNIGQELEQVHAQAFRQAKEAGYDGATAMNIASDVADDYERKHHPSNKTEFERLVANHSNKDTESTRAATGQYKAPISASQTQPTTTAPQSQQPQGTTSNQPPQGTPPMGVPSPITNYGNALAPQIPSGGNQLPPGIKPLAQPKAAPKSGSNSGFGSSFLQGLRNGPQMADPFTPGATFQPTVRAATRIGLGGVHDLLNHNARKTNSNKPQNNQQINPNTATNNNLQGPTPGRNRPEESTQKAIESPNRPLSSYYEEHIDGLADSSNFLLKEKEDHLSKLRQWRMQHCNPRIEQKEKEVV